ncbi:hypothetical protein PHSY_005294 [Pseudozyma hubeiensis SY62]|uniref:Uncharacterized protein n=1 Tax=Pseudozyma hubeiensis (strain SY62) TaxID=1305764 RepID=R9P8W8_PSEHS|nr:hypothetical protein PHSY_005294 [Pseudozyma hubeiensis SY62]GAC97707.1 hypothetical protein PHSY_005294 [Pseudozyma hubeiensis SY62]
MSRRLVSYSDLTEDGAEAQQPSGTEAGPSSYSNAGAGGGRAKKRKLGSNGSQGKKKTRANGVHWDDPAYAGQMEREGGLRGGYRDLGEVEEVDEEERGSVGEDVDDRDDGVRGESDDVEGVGGGDGVYTGWKYDEWGEPYDGTQTLPEEAYDDDDEFDYDDEYDSDHSSSSNTPALPFVIPDVSEYHRQHDPHPSPLASSTTPSSTPHRPPHAVGGGGRTLTHLELYSPLSLVQTFNSALSQYCTLHALPLPRFTGSSESALWNDAPKHDSLLAQQVREDTQQVLAQRGTAVGVTGSGVSSGGGGGGGKSQQQQAKARGKPIVTAVSAADMEGNAAWKKAIKTVETTPNRVGWIWPAVQPTGTNDQTSKHSVHAAPPQTVAAESISLNNRAASSNHHTVQSDTPANGHADLDMKLHHYWYAGYYAALAACRVTPTLNPDSSVPSQAPKTDPTDTAPTPTSHTSLIPATRSSIDPPQTPIESSPTAPQ